MKHVPSYCASYADKTLAARIHAFRKILSSCTLCPRSCHVNRSSGKKGFCGEGKELRIAHYYAHYGEEPPLSGTHGSGVIFFSGCTARCIYCQNHRFSQEGVGAAVTVQGLAQIMLDLQHRRCHNINLVSPTHFIPQILEALRIAAAKGLRIPLVYNSSGYERPEIITLLKGIIDLYLVDAKYADDAKARALSSMPDYARVNIRCIREMLNQVGFLVCDKEGVATRGVIVRHLILPGGLSQTEAVFKRLKENFSKHLHVSLMNQYVPDWRASSHPVLKKKTSCAQKELLQNKILEMGFYRGWMQE